MKLRIPIVLLSLSLAFVPRAGARTSDPLAGIGNLKGRARIVHVLDRLGYGPRPGEVARVEKMGLYNYILLQLHPSQIPDTACQRKLSAYPDIEKSATELVKQFRLTKKERKRLAELDKEVRQLKAKKPVPREKLAAASKELKALRLKSGRYRPVRELAEAKIMRDVCSKRQLEQVMVDFWFNHFNIDARKGEDALLIPEYQEKVIRRHAFGKFHDLLLAVAQSPAMLYYLDNWMSVAPTGAPVTTDDGRLHPRRRHRKKGRGINENYGRELMELHTMGVSSGFTQQDVIEVAKCLTGWTITNPYGRDGEVAFRFRPQLHDAEPKTVLGVKFPGGRGIEDGLEVLHMLAYSPHTALFISKELCQRFVSDHPPRSLVERCAGTFLKTGGSIRQVLYRIFTSPEFLSKKSADSKVKKPTGFVASALRALGIDTDGSYRILRTISSLGEPLYECQPPTGYSDLSSKWRGSNETLGRVNFAVALAFGRIRGARPDYRKILAGAPRGDVSALAAYLIRRYIGHPLSKASEAAIGRAITKAKELAKRRRRGAFVLEAKYLTAMILASPEFQMK